MVSIAIVGDEENARIHTDAWRLAAGIDPSAVVVTTADNTQGSREWDVEVAALLLRPDIQAVVVSTALTTRADIATRAALAGKHLLVKQPVATSPLELDRLLAACRQTNATLTALQPSYHQPEAQTLKSVLGQEEVGPLCVGYLTSIRGWTTWEKQEWQLCAANPGLFLAAQALDLLDVAGWLFDSAVTEVFARGCVIDEIENNPQYANILIRYAGGAQLVLDIGRSGTLATDAGLQNYTYIGRAGSVASDPRGGNLLYGPHGALRMAEDPVPGTAESLRLWSANVAAGRAGDPDVALRGVKLTQAIAASIATGAPIALGG